jgi:hypothetical protein
MRRSRLGEVCAGVDAASQRITTTWLNIFVGALFERLVAISELSGKVPILAWPRLDPCVFQSWNYSIPKLQFI